MLIETDLGPFSTTLRKVGVLRNLPAVGKLLNNLSLFLRDQAFVIRSVQQRITPVLFHAIGEIWNKPTKLEREKLGQKTMHLQTYLLHQLG